MPEMCIPICDSINLESNLNLILKISSYLGYLLNCIWFYLPR